MSEEACDTAPICSSGLSCLLADSGADLTFSRSRARLLKPAQSTLARRRDEFGAVRRALDGGESFVWNVGSRSAAWDAPFRSSHSMRWS